MLLDEIHEAVKRAVSDVVDSSQYRTYASEHQRLLADELAATLELDHCLLTSSGSAAAEIALRAAGVGAGDEVVLSAYDYPGNFWAIERTGAKPVLIDVQPASWGLCLDRVERVLSDAQPTKALIASHLHGEIQDTATLRRLCENHGVTLIADCCQSIGATIDGKSMALHGHLSIASFGGGKLLSAGRGGALLTNDERLAQKARIEAGAGSGPYALSEVQAAIVRAQIPFLSAVDERCSAFFAGVDSAISMFCGWGAVSAVGLAAFRLATSCTTDHRCESVNEAHQDAISRRPILGIPHLSASPVAEVAKEGAEVAKEVAEVAKAGAEVADQDTSKRALRNSYYQAGWAVRSAESLQAIIAALKSVGILAGTGFPGFHRRSNRRCRVPYELHNTPCIVDETVVIHHRVALEERFTDEQVAEIICKQLN